MEAGGGGGLALLASPDLAGRRIVEPPRFILGVSGRCDEDFFDGRRPVERVFGDLVKDIGAVGVPRPGTDIPVDVGGLHELRECSCGDAWSASVVVHFVAFDGVGEFVKVGQHGAAVGVFERLLDLRHEDTCEDRHRDDHDHEFNDGKG